MPADNSLCVRGDHARKEFVALKSTGFSQPLTLSFDGSDSGFGDVHHMATAEMPEHMNCLIQDNDNEIPVTCKAIGVLLHDGHSSHAKLEYRPTDNGRSLFTKSD